jgi:hypothetical protein
MFQLDCPVAKLIAALNYVCGAANCFVYLFGAIVDIGFTL